MCWSKARKHVHVHVPDTAINYRNLHGDEPVLLITLNIDIGRHADTGLADDPLSSPHPPTHLGHQSSTSTVSQIKWVTPPCRPSLPNTTFIVDWWRTLSPWSGQTWSELVWGVSLSWPLLSNRTLSLPCPLFLKYGNMMRRKVFHAPFAQRIGASHHRVKFHCCNIQVFLLQLAL